MLNQTETNIKLKFAKQSYVSNIIKLLTLTQPNKVLPVNDELCEIEDKINKCKTEFTDSDECSTVALTSNPSSFASNESAEEYFSTREYSFNPSNFNMLSVLGSGSFGTVLLAEYESRTYAIKKLPKSRICKTEFDQVVLEKQILMQMDDPFILRLYGTCQTNNELYFVTEALEHGDLYSAIYEGERLTHDACVFYGAGVILGLDFIHRKNVVFRDLKPENIMIGSNGYPKIIDFGLAKQLPYMKMENGIMRTYSKCHTLCGTPEYVAPELIRNKGYDAAIDIWGFGVMLYEMICRRTPFMDCKKDADYVTKLFTNILMCADHGIEISNKIDKKTDGTSNARDLFSQLLSGDKTARLGQNNAPSSLLDHPYFLSTGITADDLYNQTIQAPMFQPQFEGRDLETMKIVEEYTGDQQLFIEF